MIWVGGVCIDKYEASIWDAAVGGNQIIGSSPSDYCSSDGQDCNEIYARSVEGVEPAGSITWLQAQQALANSGKRLPTNAEWQMVVAGTPDPGATPSGEDCNTNSSAPEATGERENCISRWGAHDMVGNVAEWVADWDERSAGCSGLLSDQVCIGRGDGDPTLRDPGAFVRGGAWFNSANAGPFAIDVGAQPSGSSGGTGFRGAR